MYMRKRLYVHARAIVCTCARDCVYVSSVCVYACAAELQWVSTCAYVACILCMHVGVDCDTPEGGGSVPSVTATCFMAAGGGPKNAHVTRHLRTLP